MTKAMIFDLDGTLGDTLPFCIEAFKRSITPLSGTELTTEDVIATFGPSEEGVIKKLIPNHYDEGIRAYWKWYRELHRNYPDPFPGIREILRELADAGVVLALVTGKSETSTMISLDFFGMRHVFETMEFGSPEGPRKEEAMRNVLAKYDLRPDEAVYVGDAPSDIRDARKVGMPIFSVAWASTSDYARLKSLGPDQVFATVDEFAEHVRRHILAGRR